MEADRKREQLEWRGIFNPADLKKAEAIAADAKVIETNQYYYYSGLRRYLNVKGKNIAISARQEPKTLGSTFNNTWYECDACRQNRRCYHAAAMMMVLERQNGPWTVYESDSEYKRRKEDEDFQRRKNEDIQKRKKDGLNEIPALDAFQDRKNEGPILFDLEKILSEYKTTPAAVKRIQSAKERMWNYGTGGTTCTQLRMGKKVLTFGKSFSNDFYESRVWGTLDSTGKLNWYETFSEKPNRYTSIYMPASEIPENRITPDKVLNEYVLATIWDVWNVADREGKEKVTDSGAETFFKSIREMREQGARKEINKTEKPKKKENVELLPRIVVEEGSPQLSFKIGVTGSRKYIVKNCYDLITSVGKEQEYVLGKRESIDFSKQTFTPQSLVLFDYIGRNKADSFGGVYQVTLKHSRLDNFYDMYQDGVCELLDKTNGIKDELVRVNHMDIRFKLTADRLADARGKFMGVVVTGFVPVRIPGSSYNYVLDRTGLSRITQQEEQVFAPFRKVADAAGYFRFQVGTDRLQEFYYRVLPGLMENPFVEFVDNCADEAANYLPPEPIFNFYLDLEQKVLKIHGKVAYGEREYDVVPIPKGQTFSEYHDVEQEMRVSEVLHRWAPNYDPEGKSFSKAITDDSLYELLLAGIPELEYYGRVHGNSELRACRVISQPQVHVGISVDTDGLLNISVTSKDLSSRELLDLYNSYVKKKRYYRLKSGDYIDLTQEEQLGELGEFLEQMDLVPMDVIKKKIQIPLYRALYLDRMLEEHDKIAASRDRTYRALIRNFKTVREAEYEVPESLEETLRPYQVYGYKWLKTLQAAGFSGILADEMGLGKTIQMISIFKEDHDEESKSRKGKKTEMQHLPSLVICPASLVYNWQEEVERFAPDLTCRVIAGTTAARKKIISEREDVDVFVTSYDLLKRDISVYEGLTFRNCVLDEAQYIKNSKSAAAKSVKLIKAEHRFALTGTPIENRLSELWSIFDFLMPGFLYNQGEFEKNYEIEITKHHDEEKTEKLKAMTSPFILRRKKEDVLKDLPAKLEEVRYARLSGEQQKIYDAQVVRMKEMLRGGELAGEEKIKIFAELMRIRQICCDPSLVFEKYLGESAKREACIELVKSAIEGGHRMLIFSQFVSMLNLLEEDLKKEGIEFYKIIGATPKEKRLQMVRDFNEGDVPVFLISLKAGGTGLNLTGADVVIHYDPWWNLAAQNQATDRAHRIGQTRQVTVFKLILRDTIEERIMKLQDAKQDLAEAILEGKSESLLSLSNEELMALLG